MIALPPCLRIELIEPLGRGAMGTVWRARHQGLDREVAVKIAEPGRGDWKERFLVEARAAAAVKSPHVVSVFDCGEASDGRPFLVMELLEGETLESRLARGPLPLAEVLEIVRQLAEGLERCHRAGVIHRDLKPANVVLCRVPQGLHAKILDFGIAKRGVGLTLPGTTMGTPAYMSPELVGSAHAVDARVDVWALAVVAYELATAALPFEGDDLPATLMAICSQPHRPIRSRRPDLDPAVEAVFTRAFARDIDDRFADARSFARALAAAVSDPAAEASPRGPRSVSENDSFGKKPAREDASVRPPSTSGRRRRRPYAAVGAALVALFLSPWVTARGPVEATAGITPPGVDELDAAIPKPTSTLEAPRREPLPATDIAPEESDLAESRSPESARPPAIRRPPPARAPIQEQFPAPTPRPDYGF